MGRPERFLLIAVYTAILILRFFTRLIIDSPWSREKSREVGELTIIEAYPLLFSEHISLRMALSAVGAFAVGAYRLITGGLMYYDLYGTLIAVVCAPLAVLAVSGFFSKSANKYFRLLETMAHVSSKMVY